MSAAPSRICWRLCACVMCAFVCVRLFEFVRACVSADLHQERLEVSKSVQCTERARKDRYARAPSSEPNTHHTCTQK